MFFCYQCLLFGDYSFIYLIYKEINFVKKIIFEQLISTQ